MNYEPKIGDIILEDSKQTGPKIVKFFMTAPTWYQYIWRVITGKQEKVEYYHVEMMINDGFSGFSGQADIIEQQWKVQLADWNPNTKQIIFRKKDQDWNNRHLKEIALKDIGKKWDVLNAVGKFLTWLTGIPLFARYVEWPSAEICINRVAYWYREAIGEKFGAKTHSELTTHSLYKYLINNDDYEVVYKKD